MDIVQTLDRLREVVDSQPTPAGNPMPMLVDKRLLLGSESPEFFTTLAALSDYIAIPYRHGNDLAVFDRQLYITWRQGRCDDEIALAVFENIRQDFDLTQLDKQICLEL
jgi:hypothetical protein